MWTVITVEPDVTTLDGLKLAVAPVGRPLAENVTVPVKPPIGVTVTVYVVLDGIETVWELGVADRLKFGARLTTSVTVVECTSDPLVPVIVSVKLLAGVLSDVVTVRVEVPDPVTEVGLKVPVAPEGSPLTLSVTTSLKPPDLLTVTV